MSERQLMINRRQAENLQMLDVLIVEPLVAINTQHGNPPPPAFHEERRGFNETLVQFLESDAQETNVEAYIRYLAFLQSTVED